VSLPIQKSQVTDTRAEGEREIMTEAVTRLCVVGVTPLQGHVYCVSAATSPRNS
jgi:hypothetical protein